MIDFATRAQWASPRHMRGRTAHDSLRRVKYTMLRASLHVELVRRRRIATLGVALGVGARRQPR